MSVLADLAIVYGWMCLLVVCIAGCVLLAYTVNDWMRDRLIRRRDQRCVAYAKHETALIAELERLWRSS